MLVPACLVRLIAAQAAPERAFPEWAREAAAPAIASFRPALRNKWRSLLGRGTPSSLRAMGRPSSHSVCGADCRCTARPMPLPSSLVRYGGEEWHRGHRSRASRRSARAPHARARACAPRPPGRPRRRARKQQARRRRHALGAQSTQHARVDGQCRPTHSAPEGEKGGGGARTHGRVRKM